MALYFRITDGTNTLYDLDTNGLIDGYQPGEIESGNGLGIDDAVEDVIDFRIEGTLPVIDGFANTINLALYQAKVYDRDRVGTAIYLEGRKDSSEAWKRSRIKSGELTKDPVTAIISGVAKSTLRITRVAGWDGEVANVPLTNANGTDVTSGLRIYNCSDGSGSSPNQRVNYFDIDGVNDLDGDMLCPSRIRISGTRWSNRLYMGITWNTDFTNLQVTFEAESMPGNTGGTADASCSNGYYDYASALWAVMNIVDAAGSWFWPVARLRFPSTDGEITLYQGNIDDTTKITHYISRLSSGFDLYPLSPIKIPAAPVSDWSSTSETIFVSASSGVSAADMDFIQFIPIDRWRMLEMKYEVADPLGIADDLMEDQSYVRQLNAPVIASGPGIWLRPGVAQRVYLLSENTTNGAAITENATVYMTYRPRYKSL